MSASARRARARAHLQAAPAAHAVPIPDQPPTCLICMEATVPLSPLAGCRHLYCRPCIAQWFRRDPRRLCPLCFKYSPPDPFRQGAIRRDIRYATDVQIFLTLLAAVGVVIVLTACLRGVIADRAIAHVAAPCGRCVVVFVGEPPMVTPQCTQGGCAVRAVCQDLGADSSTLPLVTAGDGYRADTDLACGADAFARCRRKYALRAEIACHYDPKMVGWRVAPDRLYEEPVRFSDAPLEKLLADRASASNLVLGAMVFMAATGAGAYGCWLYEGRLEVELMALI